MQTDFRNGLLIRWGIIAYTLLGTILIIVLEGGSMPGIQKTIGYMARMAVRIAVVTHRITMLFKAD